MREEHLSDFRERLSGNNVLLIAPGRSSMTEEDKIKECIHKNAPVTISINYEYNGLLTDFIFVSNLRRYRELPLYKRGKCIVTSNIPAVDVYLQVRYKDLLNETEYVEDNAGLMITKLLLINGVKKVFLAGMDGYAPNSDDNYAEQRMNLFNDKGLAVKKNVGISMVLGKLSKSIDIEFITTPKYIIIGGNEMNH